MNKANYTINIKQSTRWVDVNKLPHLAFDHESLITTCVNKLKKGIKVAPIAFHMLQKHFRLTELVDLYIVVLDKSIDKRNFLRKLKDLNIIENTGFTESNVSHRPAELYKYNIHLYRTLLEKGKDFRLQ